jgi:5'-3' exonuclease
MGVPGIYRWLKNNYNGALIKRFPKVKSLSIDGNGILHKSAQTVYGYDEYGNIKLDVVEKISSKSAEELQKEYFHTIWNEILKILFSVNPEETFIFAIDGVAPYAKINQQRKRRFVAAAKKHPGNLKYTYYSEELKDTIIDTKIDEIKKGVKSIFDSNSITPGTKMMIELNKFLIKNFTENRYIFPRNLIYTSHLDPGEGEHKIFKFFRDGIIPSKEEDNHIIYGLDADLIMLSLLSKKRIYLMREDLWDIVSIPSLSDLLRRKMGTTSAIDDFVFLSFFMGNDFLPSMPSLNNMDYLSDLLNVYLKSKPKINLIINNDLSLDNFYDFMEKLSNNEENFMKKVVSADVKYISPLTQAATTNIKKKQGLVSKKGNVVIETKFDFNSFRNEWYSYVLRPKGDPDLFEVNEEKIENMCESYIKTLVWNYKYYKLGHENINNRWFYEYYHTPLMIDLKAYASYKKLLTNLDKIPNQDYFNPIQQMLAVLPRYSQTLLPFEVQHLFRLDSPIADIYPTKFLFELFNVNKEHQGVAILPFADINRIDKAIDKYTLLKTKTGKELAQQNAFIFKLTDEEMIIREENIKFSKVVPKRNPSVERTLLPQKQPHYAQSYQGGRNDIKFSQRKGDVIKKGSETGIIPRQQRVNTWKTLSYLL